MRFTCAFTAKKKYVDWLNIMPIMFCRIFGPCITTLKTSPCFKFKEFIPSLISPVGNICSMKLGNANVLFVSSSESLALGSPLPVVFNHFQSAIWVLIVNQIIIKSDQINHRMAQISFCLCLQHPELFPLQFVLIHYYDQIII